MHMFGSRFIFIPWIKYCLCASLCLPLSLSLVGWFSLIHLGLSMD